MSNKEVPETSYTYQPEAYLRTGVNLSVFTWLAVLGLPALVLFLIYSKMDERMNAPVAPHAVQVQQSQH